MRGSETTPLRASLELPGIFRVFESYSRAGLEIVLGNPDFLSTQLARDGSLLSIGAGLSLSDILVFQWIAEIAPWKHAFVIGNAFGFSTLLLASLSPGCCVDAIDAEIEGAENRSGSELTRRLAKSDYPGVRLTSGFSPQDIPAAARFDAYDFVFIDGMHTNEQLLADYRGIRHLLSKTSVVYCHDVGMAKLNTAWARIQGELLEPDDEAFDLHFTSFGSTLVVRGIPALSRFLRTCCRPLESSYYYFGARGTGFRTAWRMLSRTIRHSIHRCAIPGGTGGNR